MITQRSARWLAVTVAWVAVAGQALAAAPVAVSPGQLDRVALVESRCPTFSWGAVAGASAFELAAFALPEPLTGDVELSEENQVLAERVAGAATSWTPSGACFAAGGRYVWFVRAVLAEEDGEAAELSEWSEGRYFAVLAPGPPTGELGAGYVRAGQERTTGGEDAAGLWLAGSDPGVAEGRSVPSAPAAVKGALPDTVGEVYGVVGTSASASGAGLAAANTAGGADLVLDGSEDGQADLRLSQSGLDRPSAADQTFTIGNSGAGGMILQVGGGIVGNGAGLVGLNASNLASGTLPDARLSGTYASALNLSSASNSFTGNGAGLVGVDADLLDGAHASAFQRHYDNVVVVAKSGGDYSTIGAALAAISASASDRYLVWVAPGTYTESVTMEPYVDIQGAGELATKIASGGSVSTAGGTVLGADNAELRFLTVENTGGNSFAIAVKNSSAAPRLTHVSCVASGGTTASYGVFDDSGSPVMTHVTISASGGATAFGVYNSGASAPALTDVTIDASDGASNYGIRSEGSSSPTLRDVTVTASGGTGSNWAVRNDSPATMRDVVATAAGEAGSVNYGVYNNNTDAVTMTRVSARASGGDQTYGVYNSSAEVVMLDVDAAGSDATTRNVGIYGTFTSTLTMTRVVAAASGAAPSNYGIYNASSSSATMRQVTVEAANAAVDGYAYGIYNNASAFTLDNSQVSASLESTGICYGVYNVAAAGSFTVAINGSRIAGSTFTIRSDSEFTTFVGASQLAGGAVSENGGTVTCVGAYDESYTSPGYTTCP